MIKNIKKQQGITLIETIIYIAIFAIIISGAVVSIYSIIGSNARNQTKSMVLEEGSFLIGKIDWVLNGIKEFDSINNNDENNFKVTNSGLETTIIIYDNGDMFIKKNGTEYKLNNNNIKVSCDNPDTYQIEKCFTRLDPDGIEANIRVSANTSEGLPFSQDFYTIKYLRK